MVKSSKGAARPVLDEVAREKLTKGLSQGQADALMLMLNFIADKDSEDMFVLKGYAGTGKTHLVKTLIEIVTNGPYKVSDIAITAPTNKAVSVLEKRKSFGKSNRVCYKTIHSLLGLTESISSTGKVTFVKGKNSVNELDNMDLLIVDETSMLHDEIFNLLEPYKDVVKIIFMGDPAQIPPVGMTDAVPFKRSLSTTIENGYMLSQIMRQQAGNPIVEASFAIRNNLDKPCPIPVLSTQQDSAGHGLVWLDPNTQRGDMIVQLGLHFVSHNFNDDSDYAKVIAWRNKTVDNVNSTIRKMIYGDDVDRIVKGERVLANKPIFNKDKVIMYTSSEEFRITDYTICNKWVSFGGKNQQFKVYQCNTEGMWSKHGNIFDVDDRIYILHEDAIPAYDEMLKTLKEKAIATKVASNWVTYYDAVKWPANISYNYAITAHKSQGSTYENVFIMEDDIDANPNIVERNRIKYTAYTRASKKLFVYRRPRILSPVSVK